MLADLIARLEALDKAATPDLEIIRYPHGGGRVFGTDGRTLVADFYNEADREYWLALRNELPRLLRLLRAGEMATTELRSALDAPCFDCERAYVDAKSSEAALREWDEAGK